VVQGGESKAGRYFTGCVGPWANRGTQGGYFRCQGVAARLLLSSREILLQNRLIHYSYFAAMHNISFGTYTHRKNFRCSRRESCISVLFGRHFFVADRIMPIAEK
jgi:hypothetical protein